MKVYIPRIRVIYIYIYLLLRKIHVSYVGLSWIVCVCVCVCVCVKQNRIAAILQPFVVSCHILKIPKSSTTIHKF